MSELTREQLAEINIGDWIEYTYFNATRIAEVTDIRRGVLWFKDGDGFTEVEGFVEYSRVVNIRKHDTALRARCEKAEAIIKQHNLCHDLHGKVGRDEFEEGCKRETIKEYGSCGWAERIATAQARVKELEKDLANARDAAELARRNEAKVREEYDAECRMNQAIEKQRDRLKNRVTALEGALKKVYELSSLGFGCNACGEIYQEAQNALKGEP